MLNSVKLFVLIFSPTTFLYKIVSLSCTGFVPQFPGGFKGCAFLLQIAGDRNHRGQVLLKTGMFEVTKTWKIQTYSTVRTMAFKYNLVNA